MKISVRLDYLFENESLENQFRFAREAGVDAVETGQLKGFDCKAASELVFKYDMPFLACGFYDMWNCRLGDRFENIQSNLLKSINCARELGCIYLLGLSDNKLRRTEEERASFIENMKPVAEALEKHDLIVLLEPHNTILPNPVYDFSHYYVNTMALAYDLVKSISSPSVKLLYDVYHEQISVGNLFSSISEYSSEIAHYHLSGVPHRNEPMLGEINNLNIAREAKKMGYNGYFGLEYFPTGDALTSLKSTINYLTESN